MIAVANDLWQAGFLVLAIHAGNCNHHHNNQYGKADSYSPFVHASIADLYR
jgi:hypothetical protein